MSRPVLVLVFALVTSGCFVDSPPTGGGSTGPGAGSTGATTTTGGATGTGATDATTTGSGTGGATSTGDPGSTGGVGTSSGAGTSEAASTSTSTSTSTSATTSSGTSGTTGSLDCTDMDTEYACGLCCAELFPEVSSLYMALAACLCPNPDALCKVTCQNSLCSGDPPDSLCYDACVVMHLGDPCPSNALQACAGDAGCAGYMDCFTASGCSAKP